MVELKKINYIYEILTRINAINGRKIIKAKSAMLGFQWK
jgi:hypothetical protein